jgi:hypothetical protein
MADFLNTQGGIALIILAQCLAVVAFVMISLLFLVYGDRRGLGIAANCGGRPQICGQGNRCSSGF